MVDINKPAEVLWTESAIQRILSTILHEMAHAIFRVFGSRCVDCRCFRSTVLTVGVIGHGPSWMTLGQAMESEARRSFGFGKAWLMIFYTHNAGRTVEIVKIRAFKNKGQLRESDEVSKSLWDWL